MSEKADKDNSHIYAAVALIFAILNILVCYALFNADGMFGVGYSIVSLFALLNFIPTLACGCLGIIAIKKGCTHKFAFAIVSGIIALLSGSLSFLFLLLYMAVTASG